MKISIVVALYNEENRVENLLSSIEKLRLNDQTVFEVCVVDDGSSDNTEIVIKKWSENHSNIFLKYKKLPLNVGRRKAREIGAILSSYDNLLITDGRCELYPDVFLELEKINYEPLVGNPIQKKDGILPRLFFLLRNKLFPKSFGESFEDIFIDQKNFDLVSKGTTLFFVGRDRFLRNQPKQESRYVNEDTGILSLIINEKKILKTAKVKCFYHQRENILEEMKHLFNRGPRFVFYYYKKGRRFFPIFNIFLIALLVMPVLVFFGFFWKIVWAFIITDIFLSWYFSQKISDFLLFLIIFPFLAFSFFAGVLKGLIIKFSNSF